jgi:hypothetical protein
LCSTYDSNFATELVLDFARLDCIGRVLLDELVQVFDTHFSKLWLHSGALVERGFLGVSVGCCSGRLEDEEVGVAITSRHVPTRAGVRAITVYTFLALALYFAHLCMGA